MGGKAVMGIFVDFSGTLLAYAWRTTLVRLIGFSNAEHEVSKQGVSFLRLNEDGTNDANGATASSATNDDVRNSNASDQLRMGGSAMDSE